jgi:serine/threonine protein kinase
MSADKQIDDGQHLDRLLADMEVDRPGRANPTINDLRVQLETLAVELRQPVAPDPFQDEWPCWRALELTRAIGLAPAAAFNAGSPDATPLPETIGPYRILAELGRGGMGTVYKALHPRLDKIVALKVLPAGRFAGEKFLERFEREMKAVGRLDHPHLIRALDAGDADGLQYLALEYADGIDLGALLKRLGRLRIADACELVGQAASGLQAAHARGMVHRDIKPSNLMLTRQEFGPPVVKVLDLGLALLASQQSGSLTSLSSDGQIMGTVEFMAPEQADDSHAVDIRADIYSLGATLYTLLTGGTIFEGRPERSLVQKLAALASQPAPPIQQRRADVPPALAAVVHRMLARDPAARFATPAEVAAALRPFTNGADLAALLNVVEGDSTAEPAEATPPAAASAPRTKSRWPRVPRVTLAAAIAAVVVLSGILMAFRSRHGEVIVILPDDVPAEMASQLRVEIRGQDGLRVADATQGWTIDVNEGRYETTLTGGGDQFRVEEDAVTVTRRGKTFVRVIRQPSASASADIVVEGADAPIDANLRAARWLKSLDPPMRMIVRSGESDYADLSPTDALPDRPFQLFHVFLNGPDIDRLGDGLADELAVRLRGTRPMIAHLDSETLTTAGLGKILELPEFSELRSVFMGNDRLDDGIFAHLAKLPRLAGMEAGACSRVTGRGIGALSACPELFGVTLDKCPLAAEAIVEMGQLPKLRYLNINQSPCDGEHIAALARLRIQDLLVSACGIDDAGVEQLAAIETLEVLALASNPITDQALPPLKGLRRLRKLDLNSTRTTAAGIADLRHALPGCEILWNGDPNAN